LKLLGGNRKKKDSNSVGRGKKKGKPITPEDFTRTHSNSRLNLNEARFPKGKKRFSAGIRSAETHATFERGKEKNHKRFYKMGATR